MKRLASVTLIAVVLLSTGCAARQARIKAKQEFMEVRQAATKAQSAYLKCLEGAKELNECAVLKEIYQERVGTFLFLNEQREREKDRTITVRKPWWQILMGRGRRRK